MIESIWYGKGILGAKIGYNNEERTLKVLEIKKQGADGKDKSSVGMTKVEGEGNNLKS